MVDVGAQVAGLIQSFGEDPRDESKPISYGSPVEEGTVLARLDDALFKARVDQSRAELDRAKADVQQAKANLWQAERELERSRNLRSRGGAVSAQEYDAALAELETARAGLAVAEASVGRRQGQPGGGPRQPRIHDDPLAGRGRHPRPSRQHRPDGRRQPQRPQPVPDRQGPEPDGDLGLGQRDRHRRHPRRPEVRFTVGAFPDRSFLGKVSQIRLNASMVQNVVTYTVVVDVDNADGKLLPYLTARVQFQVEERPKVLLVPNVALRFRPRRAHRPVVAIAAPKTSAGSPDGDGGPAGDRGAIGPRTRGSLWVRQGDFVRPVAVQVGATDGLRTEVMGEGLAEGLDVVIGQRLRDVGVASPFLPNFKKSARTR